MEVRFSTPIQTAPWGPSNLLYNGYQVIPGGEAAGAWQPPPPSNAKVKESVDLYLYFTSGPLWPVLGELYVYLSTFFQKSCSLYNNVEKYLRAGQATDYNTVMHFACWIPKVGNTHSEYGILTAVPLQQWLHKYMLMVL